MEGERATSSAEWCFFFRAATAGARGAGERAAAQLGAALGGAEHRAVIILRASACDRDAAQAEARADNKHRAPALRPLDPRRVAGPAGRRDGGGAHGARRHRVPKVSHLDLPAGVHQHVGGLGQLLMMGQGGHISHHDTVSNLQLFSKEVLPRLGDL